MNQKQAQKFLEKVYPNSGIEIRFYNENSYESAYIVPKSSPPVIFLNSYAIKEDKMTYNDIRKSILHELGHIVCGHDKTNPKNELEAQLFVLKVADKFKMVGVFRSALLALWFWSSQERVVAEPLISTYYNAYRMFIRNKNMVKKFARKRCCLKRVRRGLLYDLKNPPPVISKIRSQKNESKSGKYKV